GRPRQAPTSDPDPRRPTPRGAGPAPPPASPGRRTAGTSTCAEGLNHNRKRVAPQPGRTRAAGEQHQLLLLDPVPHLPPRPVIPLVQRAGRAPRLPRPPPPEPPLPPLRP